MTENDSTSTDTTSASDRGVSTVTRRRSLALLGLAGIGSLDLFSGAASAESAARPWKQNVDASGYELQALGSLSMEASGVPIRKFEGDHLTVDDEGTLNADEVPDTIHYVNHYPGDTLDQKIDAVIDEIVSEAGTQAGHRIVIPPPSPDDPAAVGGAAWRFEDPVEITDNVGKLIFDIGWSIIFATAPIESFFIIGADEKTENVDIDGGFFYASGSHDDPNVERSFIQVRGIGHMDVTDVYLQNLAPNADNDRDESRNVPMGFEIRGDHGTSGVTIQGCEVTGCTEALSAEGVFSINVNEFNGGGGDHCIVADGCEIVDLKAIHSGGAPIQSIKGDIVRLTNATGPNDNVTIIDVDEENNWYEFEHGVNAVDVTGGSGQKHQGIHVSGVNVDHAKYSTNLEWALDFDQQSLTPAPTFAGTNGATRVYDEGVQTFTTLFSHEFRVDGGPSFAVHKNDVEVAGAGNGAILTTPNGQDRYRVSVDNGGNLVTEQVGGEEDRTGTVDSFEDGDLSEYFGATDAYVVNADPPVADGEYSLKNTTGDTAIFGSTSGLPRYPKAGDTFSAKAARTEANPNLGIAFGMQDTENFYFARIYPGGSDTNDNPDDDDRLQLYKRENGGYTQLAKSVLSVETGVFYDFVVDWGKTGDISVSVRDPDGNEVSSVSGTDTTFTQGGVGARRTGALDDIRIR